MDSDIKPNEAEKESFTETPVIETPEETIPEEKQYIDMEEFAFANDESIPIDMGGEDTEVIEW